MKYLIAFLIPLFFLACGNSTQNSAENAPAAQALSSQSTWFKPDTQTTWQWQISASLNTSYEVDLYDIDLFDTDPQLIEKLHAQGKKVICYFSAGSYEEWREDKNSFPPELLGDALDGWAGEQWLNISSELLKPIMRNRLDLAREKGCDGVEPDNVDGYSNTTGFALSAADQLAYNIFLADEAHKRGLSIGLKNDVAQIDVLEAYFDFAVNEQCHYYNECDALTPFIQNNKPVFNAEYKQAYVDNTDNQGDLMCESARNAHFQTLILPQQLDDAFRVSCN